MSKLSAEEVQLYYYMLEKLTSMSGLGANGSRAFAGTGNNTGLALRALSIREDATAFTSLTMTSDSGVDLDHAYFSVGGATFIKGDLLCAPFGYTIVQFQLSSGSVLGT